MTVESTKKTAGIAQLAGGRARFDPLILALLIALALLVAAIGVQKPDVFFLPVNLLNIGQAITMIGLVALAQTVIIITGGMDISIGSTVGLVSICIALAMKDNNNLAAGILTGLAVGGLAGLVNGLLITWGGLEPIIATLGTMAAFRGAAFIITNGAPIGIMNPVFNQIGSGRLLGIPVPVVILVVVTICFYMLLNLTRIGRNIFAIGGNATAARLSGINIQKYRLAIYGLSGLVAGIAAIVLTARSNAGQPNAATGLELQSIIAAVLGGTAMAGGKGSALGTILGVLILGVLNNGMVLLNVNQFWQFIAQGALLIVAVGIQVKLNRD